MATETTITLPGFLGFGILGSLQLEPASDGGRAATYYYLPPNLNCFFPSHTLGALNWAAKEGAQSYEDAVKVKPPLSPPEAAQLTEYGRLLLASFPKYVEFEFREPWIYASLYHPEQPDPRVVRANDWDAFATEFLKCFPQNEWAKLHLNEYRDLLHHRNGNVIAYEMWAPMRDAPPEEKKTRLTAEDDDDEEWTPQTDLPRAHTSERVEYPEGLYKTVYVTLFKNKVEPAKKWTQDAEWGNVIEGAVCVLQPGREEIKWNPHPLLKLEVPARAVPWFLRVAKETQWEHSAEWVQPIIQACYSPPVPFVAMNQAKEPEGWFAACICPEPAGDLPDNLRAELESKMLEWVR
ncbi:MAG: hypothetical protein IH851_11785 [Armatimonadetes bacterium]|nr:hypothetical protein [Armatimonadota bacterium]